MGGTYREAILPMTVQRRLDPPRVLEGSKDAVLDMKAARAAAGGISYSAVPATSTNPRRLRTLDHTVAGSREFDG